MFLFNLHDTPLDDKNSHCLSLLDLVLLQVRANVNLSMCLKWLLDTQQAHSICSINLCWVNGVIFVSSIPPHLLLPSVLRAWKELINVDCLLWWHMVYLFLVASVMKKSPQFSYFSLTILQIVLLSHSTHSWYESKFLYVINLV